MFFFVTMKIKSTWLELSRHIKDHKPITSSKKNWLLHNTNQYLSLYFCCFGVNWLDTSKKIQNTFITYRQHCIEYLNGLERRVWLKKNIYMKHTNNRLIKYTIVIEEEKMNENEITQKTKQHTHIYIWSYTREKRLGKVTLNVAACTNLKEDHEMDWILERDYKEKRNNSHACIERELRRASWTMKLIQMPLYRFHHSMHSWIGPVFQSENWPETAFFEEEKIALWSLAKADVFPYISTFYFHLIIWMETSSSLMLLSRKMLIFFMICNGNLSEANHKI